MSRGGKAGFLGAGIPLHAGVDGKGLGRKQVVVSKGKGAFPSWEPFTIIDCVSDVSNTGLLG